MDFRHIKNWEIGTYVEGGVGGEAPRGKNFQKMGVHLLAGKARFIAELFHN